MPDYKQVRHERLYVKEPGTERLRKNAAGRLRRLLGSGWRETERWHAEQYITVRLERSGVSPWIGKPIRVTQADQPPRRDATRRQGPPGGRGGR